MPAPLHRSVTVRAVAVAAIAVVALAGCGIPGQVTGYGPEAEANFVDACSTDRQIVDGSTVERELAAESYCTCVYEGIRDTFPLEWDDLAAYEKEVAAADEGEMPEPPSQLVKAREECNRQGPAGPSGSDDEDTPTTEG